jgi:hypothetical protein
MSQTPVSNVTNPVQFQAQPFQRPEACLPCHQRQFDELRQAVKAGYRNVSPLFNGLESAGNLINGGLLRPVYSDSTIVLPDGTPLNTNMFSSPILTETRQVQAGFCVTCHNANIEMTGEDPHTREVPALPGVGSMFDPTIFRPLRDYAMMDSTGTQVLPATIGGYPPGGVQPSIGAAGITCDFCHDQNGPNLERSFQHDGFGNTSLYLNQSKEKVGPFLFPVGVKNNFHVASNDTNKIAFLRAGAFCNSCHDVRLPNNNLTSHEVNANMGGSRVNVFRLENLSTEWQIGAYNSTNNPFGKVVRCQDCHMSEFPYAGTTSYQVGDLSVTSPTPGVFPTDYAAVPGVSTDQNFPLQKRQVVTHFFTGVDVPLLPASELQARLGATYPDPYANSIDTHGLPVALAVRRQDLMKAATRVSLTNSDPSVVAGSSFMVRLEALSLTGHRFPAGFSQERTAYVQLSVTDANGFVVYQSGYVVDKPHPNTGEAAPDGNMDDEDIEHVHAVVDPGHYAPGAYTPGTATNGGNNIVFELGPDDGPEQRVFAGIPEGLVLFRNELTHIFLPCPTTTTTPCTTDLVGRTDAQGNQVHAQTAHFEETFNAALANSVDNFRSLQPLTPRTYTYQIQLPTAAELQALGVTLKGPLQVHAQVNFEHFPPLFLRYLAQTNGSSGPTGNNLGLVDEQLIDSQLKNIQSVSSADVTVNLLP